MNHKDDLVKRLPKTEQIFYAHVVAKDIFLTVHLAYGIL
jgi:hypothetical protein